MTSLACPPTTTSVIELIAEATTRMTTLWDEIIAQSDRVSAGTADELALLETVNAPAPFETSVGS